VLEQLRGASGSHDRHIAYLRFDVGMKQNGIARITGLTRAGVARRLARIRARATRLWMNLPVEEREAGYGRGVLKV
jgi:CRP-like cAMP-binding protein